MDIDLDKLDSALTTWMIISNHIDEMQFRYNDLFNDISHFILDKFANPENLEYLKTLAEQILEYANKESKPLWIKEARLVSENIDTIIEYSKKLKEEMLIYPHSYNWNKIISIIDKMNSASYRIERLSTIGLDIYYHLTGKEEEA